MNWLNIITSYGTFVFAITGALKARIHQMDIFGEVAAMTDAIMEASLLHSDVDYVSTGD